MGCKGSRVQISALRPTRTCRVSRLRRQTGGGFCHEPLVRGLPVESSMRSMVIVVVLPFTKLVVEQVDVVGDAWPATGFVDTWFRAMMLNEVADEATEVQPRVQARGGQTGS